MATDKENIKEASRKYWEKKKKKLIEGMEKDDNKSNLP